MAQLVQTFSGDTAIRLQNEEFVRKMHWGTNWHKIRIALHHAIPEAVADLNTPTLYIGVCEGNTNTFKSGATTDWAGGSAGGGSWTYVAGPPAGVTTVLQNPNGVIRSGAVTTSTAGGIVNNYIGVTNRDFWVFDITKTSTGFTLGTRTPAAPPADMTPANFAMYAAMEGSAPGLVTATVNVAYSGNYLWDNVSVYWDYASVGYEISEILAIRLA